jgi:predicted transcriptional regulator
MRTTVRLSDQLLAQAKKRAADSGRTLTAVIEDALRQSLQRRPAAKRPSSVKLRTVKGSGVRPGVDLDDSSALLDAMER